MKLVEPGPGGFITTEQAADLCGVKPVTVRNWILRGYTGLDGQRHHLPAHRFKRRLLPRPRRGRQGGARDRERRPALISPRAA